MTLKAPGGKERSWTRPGPVGWIGILFVTLVALDTTVFAAYRDSNPTGGFGTQLVGYLGSSAFSVITVSIMIPILLVFLNSYFSIGTAVQQRIQNQKKETRQKLADAIDATGDFWDKLYMLCGEVVYLREYGDTPQLRSLKQRMGELECRGEALFTAWGTRFSNLSSDSTDLFVQVFNSMLNCMDTVMASIRICDRKPEAIAKVTDLQDSLDIVRVGLANMIHVQMLTILDLSAHLALNYDADGNDLSPERRAQLQADIDRRLSTVRNQAVYLAIQTSEEDQVLPNAAGANAQTIRDLAFDLREWIEKNPMRPVDEFARFHDLQECFFRMTDEEFRAGTRAAYSPDFINHLARGLTFAFLINQLNAEGALLRGIAPGAQPPAPPLPAPVLSGPAMTKAS